MTMHPGRSKAAKSADRIPARTVAAFSATGLMYGALATPLTVYLPNYYASHLGMAIGAVGAVFVLIKLLDIVFDPLMGMLMDRTRTPIGRYRFWLLVSAPVLMLGGYMAFMAPKGVGAQYLAIWLGMLYVGYSLVILAPAAWGAALARGYNERSRIFSWVQFVGVAGAVAILLLPSIVIAKLHGDQALGVHVMGWFIVIAAPITTAIVCFGTPEILPPSGPKGSQVTFKDYITLARRPAMLRLIACDFALSFGPGFTAPLYLFFFQQARGYTPVQANYLLLLYIVAGLLGAPVWSWLARRLGKHRTLMSATVLYAVAQAGLMILPKATVSLMAPGMFIAGFIASSFVFLVRAMVADVGDEVRLETGKDRTGMLYAFVTSTLKIGAALAVGVTYTILAKIGFDARPGVINTPSAIHGLELCYVFVPVIMGLFGGVVLIGYKLDGKTHAAIRGALDIRDAAALRLAAAEEAAPASASGGANLPISAEPLIS
jgi:GPH family glycoside/pentoside/hexuronide:cation symporter